jgi:alpha-tubulin suppressor-like RCC1 family protein
VVLSVEGNAYLFGRNTSGALGLPSSTKYVSELDPICLRPSALGIPNGVKFVTAACGRSHTLLVTSEGKVWAAGANSLGQVSGRSFEGLNHQNKS